MNTATRALIPSAACQQLLDNAYSAAKTLLVAHGDVILTNHLMSGGDAAVDAWLSQAWTYAQQKKARECRKALLGWYGMLKARIHAAPATATCTTEEC